MTLIVRTATGTDLTAVADIARAHDLGPVDSGADPRYVGHLLTHGRLAVAQSEQAGIIGFAGSLPVGAVTMLTDLFVRPAAQGMGAGGALLAHVLDGSSARMTFASHDPRALGLYTRAGMTARWALLYLRGDPARLARRDSVTAVTTSAAAAWEQRWHGPDRSADYAYWIERGGSAHLVGDPASPRAVAVSGSPSVLNHVAVAPGGAAGPAVLDAVAAMASPTVRLHLPSVHPALEPLLRLGFVIDDFDLFMTTEADIVGGPTGAYDPGLV